MSWQGRRQCQALDNDGRKCRRQATRWRHVHLDRDCHDTTRVTWIRVGLCAVHDYAEGMPSDEVHA